MPRQFKIPGHLIIPFACPKWEIEDIKIVGVSTKATYFETETHCVYVNRDAESPLMLSNVTKAWSLDNFGPFYVERSDGWQDSLSNIEEITIRFGNLATDSEREFVHLYFQYLREQANKRIEMIESRIEAGRVDNPKAQRRRAKSRVFACGIPLPQAHLYVHDPLRDSPFLFRPENMRKVDFAFWTGQRFVAVEVDGGSHVGSQDHVEKDRMLQRAGVHVIHILNRELDEFGQDVTRKLLPSDVLLGCQSQNLPEGVSPTDPLTLPF